MIDVNKPVTNPALVSAIKKMRENETTENKDNVLNEVMQAHFISPVIISPRPEAPNQSSEVVLKEKTTISYHMVQNTENKSFFMAFTDWDALRKWQNNENQQTMIMTFDDFSAMVLNKNGNADGFVINPFGENITFTRSMIEPLKAEKDRRSNGGVVEQVVKKDTKVQLGQPREYPHELVNAIITQLKKMKNVEAAYLQLMIKEGEQSYLVVVDFIGEKRVVFDTIAKVAMPLLKGMFIDLVPFDSDFGHSAVKNIEPFYKKKKFGLF